MVVSWLQNVRLRHQRLTQLGVLRCFNSAAKGGGRGRPFEIQHYSLIIAANRRIGPADFLLFQSFPFLDLLSSLQELIRLLGLFVLVAIDLSLTET